MSNIYKYIFNIEVPEQQIMRVSMNEYDYISKLQTYNKKLKERIKDMQDYIDELEVRLKIKENR